MLGDFIYTEEEVVSDCKPEESRNDAPRKTENALKRFLVIAAIVIFGGLVWWVFVSPAMSPATVYVFSFQGLDRGAVLHQANIGGGTTFISFNAAEAQQLLSSHPLVESARVVANFPDRISIHLEPRQAVAVSIARINGRMQPVHIDRHGVPFMTGGGGFGGMPVPCLPVVSGLHNDTLAIQLGTSFPEPILPLFSRIGAIMDTNPSIWQAISEINIAWNDNGTYDLVLFPVNSSIRLRMGGDINVANIYYALLMLDVVHHQFEGLAPSEIDVRSGIGVLATEEARLGG